MNKILIFLRNNPDYTYLLCVLAFCIGAGFGLAFTPRAAP